MFWKIILIIILIIIGLELMWILLLTVSALLVKPDRIYTKDSPYYRWLFNISTAILIFAVRIHMHVTGLENIPQEGRFLLVGNHMSNYDPILTEYVLRKYKLAFISKEANMHIPWFGRIIRRMCFLSIDREHPSAALKTVEMAAGLIRADEVSVAVYPEGTRSKDGTLLPFHNAVFKIAKMAEVPITVVAVRGTNEIFGHLPFRKTDVYLDFLGTLDGEYVKSHRTVEIGGEVDRMLRSHLGQ